MNYEIVNLGVIIELTEEELKICNGGTDLSGTVDGLNGTLTQTGSDLNDITTDAGQAGNKVVNNTVFNSTTGTLLVGYNFLKALSGG